MCRYIKTNNLKGQNVVCVLSGANVDFNRLRFIAERAEIGEDREVMLSVIIPEKPGTYILPLFVILSPLVFFIYFEFFMCRFNKLYSVIYPRNVTEVSYRYSGPDEAFMYGGGGERRGEEIANKHNRYIAFEVSDSSQEVPQIMEALEAQDMKPINITQNEMAKSHARYLVGGRSSRVCPSPLFRSLLRSFYVLS